MKTHVCFYLPLTSIQTQNMSSGETHKTHKAVNVSLPPYCDLCDKLHLK